MRLLVVEDSPELLKPLVSGLKRSGYAVDQAGDGKTAHRLTQEIAYDLIVLDIMLPGLDGIGVLKKLRAAKQSTRVLLLTAKDSIEDRVAGLRAGADDYLVKPFAFDELLARIEALLRRPADVQPELIHIANWTIDLAAKSVLRERSPVELTAREFAILDYLLRNRGRVVSRTEIEQHVYDSQVEPMSNVVDAAIYSIRCKLDKDQSASLIQTRRGLGYCIARDAG